MTSLALATVFAITFDSSKENFAIENFEPRINVVVT